MDNLMELAKVSENILTIPSNKRDVNRLAAKIITDILHGNVNALEVDMKLRFLEELIGQIRGNERIKAEVLNEAEKYPEKTFTAYGGEVTKTSFGRYDYSECSDTYYNDIITEIAELNKARKEREGMLQRLTEPMAIEETGEIINPPEKTSSSGLRVRLL